MTAGFSVSAITPVLGGEVDGLDLSEPPDDATFRQLEDALTECQVLFFRDQDISVEAQMALGAHFGELVAHPNDPGLEGHPEVMMIHADETSKRVAGESWHSDVSCEVEPPMGSILRIHTLPESGGDTLFASMYTAYEALSEPMKRFLESMTAVHDGAPYYRSVNLRVGRAENGREYPHAEHPIVRTQGALRQFDVHDAHRRTAKEGARRHPWLLVRVRCAAAIPVPLPMAEELDGFLGQPLRAAPGDLGLLAADAFWVPRDDQGRAPGLTVAA